MPTFPWKATLDVALTKLPGPQGERYAEALSHGTLSVLIYAPEGHDPQEPHEQDEVYVVISGSGTFLRGEEHVSFNPGDVLFVPARLDHRFVDFSDDLVVWVVFYGPPGGEQKTSSQEDTYTMPQQNPLRATVIDNRDQLIYAMTEVAELEHILLCQVSSQ